MTLEYRQYVPEGTDPNLIASYVRGNLSMQATLDDDPHALANDVVITVRDSRRGGCWVHGALDRPAVCEDLHREVPRAEFEIDTGHAYTPHEPVDLGPEEYAAHLEEKRNR